MTRTEPLRVEFAVTPRFDVFYALFALTSSGPGPLGSWKERANGRLQTDFDILARRVAPLPIFWPLLADAVQHVAGEMSFDELVSTIRETPMEDLRRNLLTGIFHEAHSVDTLLSRKNGLKKVLTADPLPGADLLGHFGLRPYDPASAAVRAVNALISETESYRDDLCLVLQRFWDTLFRADWLALEPSLRAESFRMRDLRQEVAVPELGRELNLPVTFDDHAREVRPRSGSAIAYDRIDRCYILASAFNTRRLWAKYETPSRRVVLYFPIARDVTAANSLAADARRAAETIPVKKDINAESVFRALGDTTRYAIASILARTPTTSADLARSLKVSKPTITHHVHALRAAGLITETPSGGSTKLSLSRDTVAALSGAAVEQLFASTAGLTLGTTRKRRDR
ncbi:MAG TPA: winged helix-turn-helix domain-containing protein [Gemmatimonadaceae bacterium]